MNETLIDRRGRPLKRVSLQKRVELRRLYVAQMPRWRHPWIGYLAGIPIVGLGMATVMLLKYLLPNNFFFPGMPLVLSVLLVALFWGMGPALLAVLLGTLALDYFYISPAGQFDFRTLNGVLQLLPFVVVGLVIAIITGQRESARLRALLAEQEANERADELEKANQELQQANKLKDQFLSMASHELKTPITTIRGQAQIAIRRLTRQRELPPELEPIRSSLEKIDAQTRRLNSLVEDLLDLSSIRAGKIALQLRECDLVELCCDVVEDQRLLSGRVIELDVPSAPLTLQADCNRLSQVIVNLVSNAVKYSPEDSPVKVSVGERDSVAVVQVHDVGNGIPRELQMLIFEPFYRAPNAQNSSKGGMGLGLAISKDIVERHGGRIWYESAPGEGTTFTVELPLR